MSFALVIGGGPAGLMAAEALLAAGQPTVLTDAKPTLGRKFLMAGKSGLNLTNSQPLDRFLDAYPQEDKEPHPLAPMLQSFPPLALREWADDLGAETFVGSSDRVFPKVMKASPLLREWIARLQTAGLDMRRRWRWTGLKGATFQFETPTGPQTLTPGVTVLALGGASWARLGSDGKWAGTLDQAGVTLTPFAASNVGVTLNWSDHMTPVLGQPLKNLILRAGTMTSRGEITLSAKGLEGGGLYPLSPELRRGSPLTLDLFPDLDSSTLIQRLSRRQGKDTRSNHLRKALKLDKARLAVVLECLRPLPDDPALLAQNLKALRVPYTGLRPLDEAISTVGGVPFSALGPDLGLKSLPGIFCAGEMIDWDAPTGGYLLTACLATGRWAGQHAARYVRAAAARS